MLRWSNRFPHNFPHNPSPLGCMRIARGPSPNPLDSSCVSHSLSMLISYILPDLKVIQGRSPSPPGMALHSPFPCTASGLMNIIMKSMAPAAPAADC